MKLLYEEVTTSLSKEYLLNPDGNLEIRKIYSINKKPTVWIYANHPSNEGFSDLLSKKNNELKTLIRGLGLEAEANLTINSEMRQALWNSLGTNITLEPKLIRVCFQKHTRTNYASKIRIQAKCTKERKREASLS